MSKIIDKFLDTKINHTKENKISSTSKLIHNNLSKNEVRKDMKAKIDKFIKSKKKDAKKSKKLINKKVNKAKKKIKKSIKK